MEKEDCSVQYKNCQSCGMPLSKDAQGGGMEADGSKSVKYCSHCYQGGKFTQPDITVDEMMSFVKGKMKSMHIPGFLANLLTRNIPKLQRWSHTQTH